MVQRLLVQINGNEQDWIYERDSSASRTKSRKLAEPTQPRNSRPAISCEGDDSSTQPREGFRPSFHSAPGEKARPETTAALPRPSKGAEPSLVVSIPTVYSQCFSTVRLAETCHTAPERSALPDPASRPCGRRSAARVRHFSACTTDVPSATVRAQTHPIRLL